MTSVSYTTLLSNWFRVHVPTLKTTKPSSVPRTGCAAAYPRIKRCHRPPSNLLSCIPLISKTSKPYTSNQKSVEQHSSHSSMRGCASFARYGSYAEGETDDDC